MDGTTDVKPLFCERIDIKSFHVMLDHNFQVYVSIVHNFSQPLISLSKEKDDDDADDDGNYDSDSVWNNFSQ